MQSRFESCESRRLATTAPNKPTNDRYKIKYRVLTGEIKELSSNFNYRYKTYHNNYYSSPMISYGPLNSGNRCDVEVENSTCTEKQTKI